MRLISMSQNPRRIISPPSLVRCLIFHDIKCALWRITDWESITEQESIVMHDRRLSHGMSEAAPYPSGKKDFASRLL